MGPFRLYFKCLQSSHEFITWVMRVSACHITMTFKIVDLAYVTNLRHRGIPIFTTEVE